MDSAMVCPGSSEIMLKMRDYAGYSRHVIVGRRMDGSVYIRLEALPEYGPFSLEERDLQDLLSKCELIRKA